MTKIVDYRNVEILRNELVVLKNVTFSLEQGEFVYLIGKVGSGKSSLLKSMYAEIPITEGDARIMDFDLVGIKKKQIPMLRRSIGIVFQDFQLLTDRSVYDNLKFVLQATGWKNKQDIDERIEESLQQVGMATKSYKMPHQLSGGEQQRIVIARALLNHPQVILADEPTGNLDPETSTQIISLLQDISHHGTAVIMATHNIQLVKQYPARVMQCVDKAMVSNISLDD
ncbi:MAG: cell division ATP-binding protein FtsE [Muribaculaceae bacterium]